MPSRKIVASLEEIRDAIREEVKKELKNEFIFDVCIKQIQIIFAVLHGGNKYNSQQIYELLHRYTIAHELVHDLITTSLLNNFFDTNAPKIKNLRTRLWWQLKEKILKENREWKSKNTKRVNIN